MLVETVNEYAFRDEMIKHGFSYEGATALFKYYEDFEEDIPFDPVAIRCEFDEYKNLQEVQDNYKDIKDLDHLQQFTTVIPIRSNDGETYTNRLIVRAF